MEDPVNILEKRVKQLEALVLPKNYDSSTTENIKKTSVINMCMDTHTMIQSALSCRDAIASVLQKLEQINSYLDPMVYIDLLDDEALDIEAKQQYILEMKDEIKEVEEMAKQLRSFKEHVNVDVSKIMSSQSKLLELYDVNARLYDESQEVTANVLATTQSYNLICRDIGLVFTKLEEELAAIEEKVNAKPKMEE